LPVGLIAQIGSAVLPEEYKPKKVQQLYENKSEWYVYFFPLRANDKKL